MNLTRRSEQSDFAKKSQNSTYGIEHFTHVGTHQHDSIAQPHSYTMSIITCKHKIGYSIRDCGFKKCKIVMLAMNCNDQNKVGNHIA